MSESHNKRMADARFFDRIGGPVDGATAERYLIWSHEHSGWWGPGERGYCPEFPEAGVYTRAEALRICARASIARPNGPYNELPVRLADLVEFRRMIREPSGGAPE